MHPRADTPQASPDEVSQLRARLEEAEDTLRAIRSGEVDALVIETPEGPKVFTLQGVDAESNRQRGEMLAQVSDAVIAVDPDERVTFLNAAAERLYAVNASEVLGRKLEKIHTSRWPDAESEAAANAALNTCGEWRGESVHVTPDGRELAVESSVSRLTETSGGLGGRLAVIREITERKRIEEELRQATQRFELCLKGSKVTLFNQDLNLRYTWAYNLAPGIDAQFIGKNDSDLLERAEELAIIEGMKREVIASGTSQQREVLVHLQGGARFYDLLVDPLLDSKGNITGVSCAAMDITVQKALENKLRLFEKVILNMTDTVVITDAEAINPKECRVLFVNPAFTTITGYAAEEIIGKTRSILHGAKTAGGKLDRIHRALLEQKPVKAELTKYRADGSEFEAEVEFIPVANETGRLTHWVSILRDVTERKRVEEELRQANHKLERVLDSITDGMLILDRDWRYTYFNKQGARLIGMRPEDLIGKNVWELFPEARESRFHEAYHRAMESGEPVQFEEYYPEPLNIWLECNCYPSPECLSVYFRDISDRKRSEAALEQNARLFSTLVEQAPMGVYVVDSELRIKQINSQALPAFENISPLLGREFGQVLEIQWGPELGRHLTAIFRHTLATGERYSSKSFSETRHDIGEEEAYEWETQRVTLPDGSHGVACYFKNVTEPKRAERALRESEERTRLATTATGVGIWEWHIGTDSVRWDAQMFSIYGIIPTQDGFVPYRTWRDAVLPEDVDEQELQLQETVRREVQGSREFRIRRKDNGKCRHILAVETIRRNGGGRVEWVVGTNLDVTERKLAEEALHDADRRKNEFLATLAHELRNPLSPLRSGLEIIRMAGDSGAIVTRAREIMEQQLGQMVRLVDDLLDVSRITHGKLTLRKERVELNAILQSAAETSRSLIHEKGQQLELNVPDTPLVLDADFTRLAQVFLNLLNNAAKYSDRGGRISVTAERQEREAVVWVRDSGIGISAAQMPHIFELFSQADRSLEKSLGGLGLGLALVKRLVEMHRGTVAARSDGPGKGSEFIVRLPLATSTSEESQPSPEASAVITAATPGRVLVVDDNVDAATTLQMALEIKGYEVAVAHDGAQAVDLAAEFLPAVILMDIGMPVLNGYDACRRIREQPWGRDIVIVALTGWGQEEDRQKSGDAGFDHHLVKPVDLAVTDKLITKAITCGR